MNESLAAKPNPLIPEPAQQQLFSVLLAEPSLHAMWLFGLRAMWSHQSGSDSVICLEGPDLTHLLHWQVDLVLRHEMPAELEAHLQRVGQCLSQHQPGSRERCREALADLKVKAEDQGRPFFVPSPETLIRQDRSR